jgi:hypothetical protein
MSTFQFMIFVVMVFVVCGLLNDIARALKDIAKKLK